MEIWFYHLQRQPLAHALPALLEKALARGWRVVVQSVDDLRLRALDDLLWTYHAESFLPHATDRDGNALSQPVLLTCAPGSGTDAALRIYIDGATVDLNPEDAAYERVVLVFDGANEKELAAARAQWSALKGRGFTLAYWQQDEAGRWNRKM